MDIRIETPGLSALIRMMDRAPAIVEAELRDGMERAVLIAEEEVVRRAPVDTGRLRNAISGGVVSNARSKEVEGLVQIANLPYAVYQEWGTGLYTEYPGQAKERYAIVPRFKKALRFNGKSGPIVRRKVMHPGVKPKRYFRDGAEAAKPRIVRIFENRVKRAMERIERAG